MFGAYMAGSDWQDMTLMALGPGRLFAFGSGLWWSDPNVVSNAQATKWLHDLAHLRQGVNDFFVRGQTAAPPVCPEKINRVVTARGGRQIHTPDLWARTWRLKDGRLMVPLVNLPKQERAFPRQFDSATYGLKANATVKIERMTADGVAETVSQRGKFALPVRLGPAEATALVITPPER
jgi:hypothetical protein